MRHYCACQDPATGRWFYATDGYHRSDGSYGFFRTGGCSMFKACKDCGGWPAHVPAVDGALLEAWVCSQCKGVFAEEPHPDKCVTCSGGAVSRQKIDRWGKPVCATCDGKGLLPNDEACDGHATAEEAYAHHKAHLLATSLRFWDDKADARTLHRCQAEGCEAFTSGGASCGAYRTWTLCKDHRDAETVSKALHVGESWES